LDFTELPPEGPGADTSGGAGSHPSDVVATGLPEMTDAERLAAELEIVGLDASRHVLSRYLPFLEALGITFAADLLGAKWRGAVLIAGVKVATQTPPVRSGRRVVFLTVDDTTGPADATFFEDAQGPYAATVFNSWLLVVTGEVRRTGPRGISIRATGAWDLTVLHGIYSQALVETGEEAVALAAVREVMAAVPEGFGFVGEELEMAEVAPAGLADTQEHGRAGGMGRRRVLVHPSGFRQSPYADVKPAGDSITQAPRKFWHSSPGSSGR
jgi:error-prone DNA polymerase